MENFELSEICYEQIKGTYYHGIFGDFKLIIDQKSGCFNATKLCEQGGKRFREWKNLEKSKNLITHYENCPRNSQGNFTYEVKGSNKDNRNKQIIGTYVPKELILDIASWVSVEFYDRCNNIVINYYVKKFKKMDNKSLKQKIKELEDLTKNMEELTLENEKKSYIIQEKEDKIDQLMKMLDEQKAYMHYLGMSLEEVKEELTTKVTVTTEL